MTTTQFHKDHTIPTSEWIWVFGSNEKGVHGKGCAKVARVNFRAAYGVGQGPTGHAYAIATKNGQLASLSLPVIEQAVVQFLAYAKDHPKLKFFVTRIGCVLAGYSDSQIAPFFANAPSNCSLPDAWQSFYENASNGPSCLSHDSSPVAVITGAAAS